MPFLTAASLGRADALAQELSRIAGIVRGLPGVRRLIVFGSFARGEPAHVATDLDLIVVAQTSLRFLDRLAWIYAKTAPRCAIDLLVYTPEEFDELVRTRPFVQQAVREGRVIFDERDAA